MQEKFLRILLTFSAKFRVAFANYTFECGWFYTE